MRFPKLLIAAALTFAGQANATVEDEDIKVYIDSPQPFATYSGINTVRGWAIHPDKPMFYVEVYIDGELFSGVPVGGSRGDVANAFPEYEDSVFSGWAQTLNFKNLEEGVHELEVRAYTEDGLYNSASTQFCSDRFTKQFISNPIEIRLTEVERLHIWNERLIMEGVRIEGRKWNMELSWNTSTQGFEITQTTPYTMIDEYTEYLCGDEPVRTCQGTWCTEE